MAFIYKITNKINNKIYIGKTEDTVEKRFKQHMSESSKDRCKHRPLYKAIKKYGKENFEVSTIEETNNPNERELFWIEFYNSYYHGYNATKGGDGKSYVDESSILELHENKKSPREISEILSYDYKTVIKILNKNKVKPNNHKHRVKNNLKVLNLTTGTVYHSQHDAARALNPSLEGNKLSSLANKISLCCRGLRKSVLKNKFKYIDPH